MSAGTTHVPVVDEALQRMRAALPDDPDTIAEAGAVMAVLELAAVTLVWCADRVAVAIENHTNRMGLPR